MKEIKEMKIGCTFRTVPDALQRPIDPQLLMGTEGNVPYTPIPNRQPCNESLCLCADSRCSSSPSPASTSTAEAVCLHSQIMFFHMMAHNTSWQVSTAAAGQQQHLNLNAVSSPSWCSVLSANHYIASGVEYRAVQTCG